MVRPGRFERPTYRFVVCQEVHISCCTRAIYQAKVGLLGAPWDLQWQEQNNRLANCEPVTCHPSALEPDATAQVGRPEPQPREPHFGPLYYGVAVAGQLADVISSHRALTCAGCRQAGAHEGNGLLRPIS